MIYVHHCFALPCECIQMDVMMTAKKRLAETLNISHETTEHVCNNMCRQFIIQ